MTIPSARLSTRGRALAVASCILAVVPVIALATPADARQRCSTQGRTIERTGEARAFRVAGRSQSRFYACAFRVGRSYRLNPDGANVAERSLALAGRVVAYEKDGGPDLGPFEVVIRSLNTGRLVHRATSDERGSDLGNVGPVDTLLVKRNGSAAWTTSSDGEVGPVTHEVHALVARRRVVLDRGVGIEPRSLRLSADRRSISWLHGAQTRSAPLG